MRPTRPLSIGSRSYCNQPVNAYFLAGGCVLICWRRVAAVLVLSCLQRLGPLVPFAYPRFLRGNGILSKRNLECKKNLEAWAK